MKRRRMGGNISAYQNFLRQKGILEPFRVKENITGATYLFDKEFLAKADRYFCGGNDEFSPKERELLRAFLAYADGGGDYSIVVAAFDAAILGDVR